MSNVKNMVEYASQFFELCDLIENWSYEKEANDFRVNLDNALIERDTPKLEAVCCDIKDFVDMKGIY